MMKKLALFTALSVVPLCTMAQDDDMYFVPTKENLAKEAKSRMPKETYYSGSDRSVDEYNRRLYSSVAPIDSAGNDVIDFSAVRGVYPDTLYSESGAGSYQLTRRMSRFDDYQSTSSAYWEGYRDGSWASPWYNSTYYYPWYDAWYDPWYYGGWYGPAWHYSSWYAPYHHYGYYGYYGPGYWGPGYWGGGGATFRTTGGHRFHATHGGSTGSRTYRSGGRSSYSNGSFGNGSRMSNGSFGSSTRTTSTGNSSFGSSRSQGSSGFGGGSSSGGGFGGSRSVGGSSGGSRSGGGFSRGR